MSSDSRSIPFLALLDSAPVEELLSGALDIKLSIANSYLTDERLTDAGAEVLAMQRLLTLAKKCTSIAIAWESTVARTVLTAPAVHPLAALTLCLNNAKHNLPSDLLGDGALTIDRARTRLINHRLTADMFSDSQMIVCVDHNKPSLPSDLYDTKTGRLLGEEDFESFVDDLLVGQNPGGFEPVARMKRRLPISVMIRELIENTHDHARRDLHDKPLRPNGLRGLVLKRVMQGPLLPTQGAAGGGASIPCMELSVFDSGPGYFGAFTKSELHASVPIAEEHDVLLKCLERHAAIQIADPRPGHRGMGLYEVLRGLQSIGGLFEVRTGRIHGYRSFLEGEWDLQLEQSVGLAKRSFPRPVLLDVVRRMLTRPTPQEIVIGSVVRVVVPLA